MTSIEPRGIDQLLLDIRAGHREGKLNIEFFFLIEIELDHLDLVGRVARDHPNIGVESGLQRDKMSEKKSQQRDVNDVCAEPVDPAAFAEYIQCSLT